MAELKTIPGPCDDGVPEAADHTTNCMAYGVRCGLLASFGVPDAGSLNYFRSPSGITFVVGDPVGNVATAREVITAFLVRNPRACFVQVSEVTAQVLSQVDYYINSVGVETELDLGLWYGLGRRSHMLRKNSKKATRAAVAIAEITDDRERLTDCETVSRTWLEHAKGTDIELLRLIGPAEDRRWENRGHFFAAAAEAMRRILVDAARRKRSGKHGGGRQRVEIPDVAADPAVGYERLVVLDEALTRLAAEDAIAARVVELRHFGGMSLEDAAACLGLSRTVAYRHWKYARAWLLDALSEAGSG